MQKWKIKAYGQKVISYLPGKNNLNYFFQKYITRSSNLSDDFFYDRLGHARDHLKTFKRFTGVSIPATCLELGTGWHPVVPISFFLAGASQIYSVDISFLTSKERIENTLRKFIECEERGLLSSYISFIPERFMEIRKLFHNIEKINLMEIIKRLNIVYLIEDARKLKLPGNSIELINSNNTFEHIYPNVLIPIMKEFKRLIKNNIGVMSHFIDMSDHYAHFDKSITIYNFLKYSDKDWKRYDNSIQPQNRLRIFDYKKIYSDLEIPINEESFREGSISELRTIKLADKFLVKTEEELAISHCHLISVFK